MKIPSLLTSNQIQKKAEQIKNEVKKEASIALGFLKKMEIHGELQIGLYDAEKSIESTIQQIDGMIALMDKEREPTLQALEALKESADQYQQQLDELRHQIATTKEQMTVLSQRQIQKEFPPFGAFNIVDPEALKTLGDKQSTLSGYHQLQNKTEEELASVVHTQIAIYEQLMLNPVATDIRVIELYNTLMIEYQQLKVLNQQMVTLVHQGLIDVFSPENKQQLATIVLNQINPADPLVFNNTITTVLDETEHILRHSPIERITALIERWSTSQVKKIGKFSDYLKDSLHEQVQAPELPSEYRAQLFEIIAHYLDGAIENGSCFKKL